MGGGAGSKAHMPLARCVIISCVVSKAYDKHRPRWAGSHRFVWLRAGEGFCRRQDSFFV